MLDFSDELRDALTAVARAREDLVLAEKKVREILQRQEW